MDLLVQIIKTALNQYFQNVRINHKDHIDLVTDVTTKIDYQNDDSEAIDAIYFIATVDFWPIHNALLAYRSNQNKYLKNNFFASVQDMHVITTMLQSAANAAQQHVSSELITSWAEDKNVRKIKHIDKLRSDCVIVNGDYSAQENRMKVAKLKFHEWYMPCNHNHPWYVDNATISKCFNGQEGALRFLGG